MQSTARARSGQECSTSYSRSCQPVQCRPCWHRYQHKHDHETVAGSCSGRWLAGGGVPTCSPSRRQRLRASSASEGLPSRDLYSHGAPDQPSEPTPQPEAAEPTTPAPAAQPTQVRVCLPAQTAMQHRRDEDSPFQNDVLSQDGLPQVPWGLSKVFQVMSLWFLAYYIIGQVVVPLVLACFGVDRMELTMRSHAILHLCLDVSQLFVTLGVMWSCLKDYKPRSLGLFPVRWKGWWVLGVALCCITFPAIDWLAHKCQNWFPTDMDATWVSNLEHSLSIGDWITNVAYVSVVSLCAPIWEEAIFRGFLLTSLARYMPTPYAIALSSVMFAMCHFRFQTFLPLLVLGIIFATVFIRTNNLLPPILLHSAWNLYVLYSIVLVSPI